MTAQGCSGNHAQRAKAFADAVDSAADANDRGDYLDEVAALTEAIGHAAVLLDETGVTVGAAAEALIRQLADAIREGEIAAVQRP